MYLIDTHTLIWSLTAPEKIGKKAFSLLSDRKNHVFVSSVSFWEISLKVSLKKFSFAGIDIMKLPALTKETGYDIISLTEMEAVSLCNLPPVMNHRDPFDRMLICQAIHNKYTMVSKDTQFRGYRKFGLKQIW